MSFIYTTVNTSLTRGLSSLEALIFFSSSLADSHRVCASYFILFCVFILGSPSISIALLLLLLILCLLVVIGLPSHII